MAYSSAKSHGFSIVELLIVVVVLAVIGIIGYRVWEARHVAQAPNTSVTAQATPINNLADLDKTDTELQNLDTDGSDISNLEAEINY